MSAVMTQLNLHQTASEGDSGLLHLSERPSLNHAPRKPFGGGRAQAQKETADVTLAVLQRHTISNHPRAKSRSAI